MKSTTLTLLDTPLGAAAALARRVADTRLALNLTQAEVARRAVVPLQTYKTFELTGRLTIERLAAVLNALGRQHELNSLLATVPVDFDAAWNAKTPKLRVRARAKAKK